MATVMIGSARADEHGKSTGGAAGDQTGREISTQAWYRHSKGWRVLRANEPAKATRIAAAIVVRRGADGTAQTVPEGGCTDAN